MSTENYFTLLTIDNRLMADLTDPAPNIMHGILDEDEWPNIRRGTTSSMIRLNGLNSSDGVQGSVTYSSTILGHSRKVTFFFVCNEDKNAASTTSNEFSSTVKSQSVDAPLIVSYLVQELVD